MKRRRVEVEPAAGSVEAIIERAHAKLHALGVPVGSDWPAGQPWPRDDYDGDAYDDDGGEVEDPAYGDEPAT